MSLKNSFQTHIAKTMLDSFSLDADDKMFFFIARSNGWTADLPLGLHKGTTASDSAPPAYNDDTTSHFDVWRRMLAAKRISDSSIFLMADKNSWTSGTVYTEYDDSTDMSTGTFYVTNAENNFYNCIYNS